MSSLGALPAIPPDMALRTIRQLAWARGITLGAMFTVTTPSFIGAQDSVAAGARVVTLAEAVAMARRNAPQTIAARGAERANQAAARAAVGAFLPSVTASAGAVRQFTGGSTTRINQSGERVTIQGNQWTYSNGFSLNAQLFNAANIPSLRAARAEVAAAQANTVTQTYTVTLNVEQQFFAALTARESEDAANTQLRAALEQLDAARRRVRAGAATASDSLTASVQVANAQLALLSAQNARRDANAALTRLTGSDTPLAASTSDPAITVADTVRLDSATVVNHAVTSPDIKRAQATVTAARANVQAARAGYLPTLNAGYSRSGSGTGQFGFGNDPFNYNGQLSLSLSVPVFNRFNTQAQVAAAAVNEANAQATLRDTELQSRQLAVQYLNARRLGQQQVAAQTASVIAAQENLRVQRQRYDLGLATLVDVLTAQTTLNQAQANLIAARNTVRLATAQIEALIGVPLASMTTLTPSTR